MWKTYFVSVIQKLISYYLQVTRELVVYSFDSWYGIFIYDTFVWVEKEQIILKVTGTFLDNSNYT